MASCSRCAHTAPLVGTLVVSAPKSSCGSTSHASLCTPERAARGEANLLGGQCVKTPSEQAARTGDWSRRKRERSRHARCSPPLRSEDEIVHVPFDRGDAEGRWPATEDAAELVHLGGATAASRVRLAGEVSSHRLRGVGEAVLGLIGIAPVLVPTRTWLMEQPVRAMASQRPSAPPTWQQMEGPALRWRS